MTQNSPQMLRCQHAGCWECWLDRSTGMVVNNGVLKVAGNGFIYIFFFWTCTYCMGSQFGEIIGSPKELVIRPRCGLWDIDNALLMTLEINSFGVILQQRNEKIEFVKLCSAQRFWSRKGLYICEQMLKQMMKIKYHLSKLSYTRKSQAPKQLGRL